jgi:hypothetical protein
MLVKSTTVLSPVKTNGDLNTAQKDIHPSTVTTHTSVLNVPVLGIVMMYIKSLLKFSPLLIPTETDKSIKEITLNLLT